MVRYGRVFPLVRDLSCAASSGSTPPGSTSPAQLAMPARRNSAPPVNRFIRGGGLWVGTHPLLGTFGGRGGEIDCGCGDKYFGFWEQARGRGARGHTSGSFFRLLFIFRSLMVSFAIWKG
jgi:hypothetical protein